MDEAQEKFPYFTTSEKLEAFKKLNFGIPTIPGEVLPTGSEEPWTSSYSDYIDSTFILEYNSAIGIFWKYDVFNCNLESLNDVFKIVSLTILML